MAKAKDTDKPNEAIDINTSIIVSYEDLMRMVDFCSEKDSGAITRDFMDWYLKESTFSIRKGILITENIFKDNNERFIVAFDFTNPDLAQFILFSHEHKQTCRFSFERELNLDLKELNIKINWFDKNEFRDRKYTQFFGDTDFGTEGLKEKTKVKMRSNMTAKRGTNSGKMLMNKAKRELKVLQEKLAVVHWRICNLTAKEAVYFVYATMYYFIRTDQRCLSKAKEKELMDSGTFSEITTIYKYSGYVNIDEQRIYKPTIKKDPNEPAREYDRHIEKWSVRGHYRRYGEKLVWIEAHERGEGALENRVYGTEKESDLDLEVKTFEVTKLVPVKEEEKSTAEKPEPPKVEKVKPEPVQVVPIKPRKNSAFRMFNTIFRKLFKHKRKDHAK